MLCLDGAYVMEQGQPRFRRVPPPTPAELEVSPQQGRKAFTLHAGVAVRGDDRKTLERLCRYITRQALAEGRLSLTLQGRVRYTLKTPYRDGTTHMRLRAAGLPGAAGRAGAETAGASDPVPRRLRAPQPVAGADHAGRAGERSDNGGHADGRRTPPGHDLGAAAEAGFRLRRGPGGDREDSGAPRDASAAGGGRGSAA